MQRVGRDHLFMKRPKINLLAACMIVTLLLGACEYQNRYETETAVPASTGERTRVVKDQIPAEGQRKIPVVEQY